jgi:cytochrome P450
MLKSKSGLVTQVSPTTFNLFNVIDKRLHRIKRKIVGQGINERAMRQFEPVMQEQISIFLTKLAESSKLGKPVDMSERCCWLALDIAGELGFGHSFELQTDTKNRWMPLGLSTSNWRLNLYMQFPAIKYSGWEKLLLPYALPKVRRYHNMVTEMIKARTSQHQNAKPDLFSAVSSYKDPETGEGLNLKQLFQEATFLIPAGKRNQHV